MSEDRREKRELCDCRVLVTPTTFGKNDPTLRSALEDAVGEVLYNPTSRPLAASGLLSMVKEIDGYIAGLDQIDASVIQAASRLKVIARYGVGVDRVDVATATKRGIVVANTPGANSAAVAELTIALMLALGRNLCQANQSTRCGEWPRYQGVGLCGKTIGLVGFGSIGREVAMRLRCFGCRILAADPYVATETAEGCGVCLVSLDEVLGLSDFVSLHASVLPGTKGMVNQDFLRKMKQGAFLVNTARGELIDEAALQRALERGHLQGAGLDSFSEEPPRVDHPLFRLPQVIVTPHTGAHTDEATHKMGLMSLQACLAALRGERPQFVVNPEVYER